MPTENSPRPHPTPAAWPALELLKFACIAGMILVHVVTYFMTWHGELEVPEGSPVMRVARVTMAIGFFPLMLPVTAGCSFFLGFFRGRPIGRLSGDQVLRPLLTGVALIGLGYLFNLVEVGWHYRSLWQILQFIGLSLVVLALLAWRLPPVAIPGAGALALAVIPWLRTEYGNSFDMDRQILIETMRQGSSWPLIPWFPLVAFGFTLAWMRELAGARRFFRPALWTLGFLLVGWALGRGSFLPPLDPLSLSGNKLFNPPPAFVMGVMGIAALALAVGEVLSTRINLSRYGIVNVFSKGILWIYLVHLFLLHHMYLWALRHIDLQSYAAHLMDGSNLATIGALWIVFLGVAYGVGYVAIRLLQEKRLHIRVRRRAT